MYMYINKDKIQGKLSVLGEGIQGGFFFSLISQLSVILLQKLAGGDRLTDIQNGLGVAKGERGSGMDVEFRVSRYKLLHLEWIHNEVLLYSPGNWIQSLGIDHDRR